MPAAGGSTRLTPLGVTAKQDSKRDSSAKATQAPCCKCGEDKKECDVCNEGWLNMLTMNKLPHLKGRQSAVGFISIELCCCGVDEQPNRGVNVSGTKTPTLTAKPVAGPKGGTPKSVPKPPEDSYNEVILDGTLKP